MDCIMAAADAYPWPEEEDAAAAYSARPVRATGTGEVDGPPAAALAEVLAAVLEFDEKENGT
jgi:hypothetical protein